MTNVADQRWIVRITCGPWAIRELVNAPDQRIAANRALQLFNHKFDPDTAMTITVSLQQEPHT
jgi:hypothetical protein